tara:strand:- start:375 stop:1370 length:996 start_codon:yes stop_codon:yes gene_type:complete
MRSVFITGGGGYCGTRLVHELLKKKYKVTVYDTFFYGNFLKDIKNRNLKIIKGDIRNIKLLTKSCEKHEFFIHLACISNDVSFELNKQLSKSINFNAFEPMVKAAKKNGVKRFIYASTSSVYGLSKKKKVTENHPLIPITLYNKYKADCEPILFKYTDDRFTGVIFRPATVCGYSPRQRLDLTINILTNHAFHKNKISVFGGKQFRPNLHIKDYCRAVILLMKSSKSKISNQTFNIGYQNFKVKDLALKVKNVVEKKFNKRIQIIYTKSKDVRSYRINSDKIFNILKFKPIYSIENAIDELLNVFKKKILKHNLNKDIYYNVERLKNLKIK